jgi:hypothetical protein
VKKPAMPIAMMQMNAPTAIVNQGNWKRKM